MLTRGAGGVLNGRLLQLISIARLQLANSGSADSGRWMQSQPFKGAVPDDPTLPLPRFLEEAAQNSSRQGCPEPMALSDALQQLQAGATAKFDETVELAVNLGTDPRRGDQMVRGVASLPHGTGKTVRVAVFAQGDAAEAARAAGAEVVGGDELVALILAAGSGGIDFDKCLATPDMMPKLGRLARVLGPRGLMPNPKLGTIVADVTPAIKALKGGRVEFRADKGAVVHTGVGKVSFTPEQLYTNVAVLMAALLNARPKSLKGSGASGYILRASVSSTMGRGVPVSIPSVLQAVQLSRAGRL